MSETVMARPKGFELFAPTSRQTPLVVGRARGDALEKLGVRTLQDLLQHYPRRHIDRSRLTTISELGRLLAEGHEGEVQVLAKVTSISSFQTPRQRKKIVKAKIADETGSIDVTWFNQTWLVRALPVGTEAFFWGKLGWFQRRLQMTSPRHEPVRTGREPFHVGRVIPVYPATAELSSDALRKIIWETLQAVGEILDPIPREIARRFHLMTRGEALRLIHFPDEVEEVIQARRRLAFDEVFTLQLGLVYRKRKLERTVQGIAHPAPSSDSLAETFVAELPFALTNAQRRACAEVASDMSKTYPMHRLLEGEVGSGKTVVALYACLTAIDNGYQAAFMAPTEVLAEQHYLTVSQLLDRAFGEDEAVNLFATVSRRPVVRLLTGSTPAAQRAETVAAVAAGEVDLLLGTHALIQEGVEFARLGVAVVDEQHRFGVHQRRNLREKGTVGEPDILVMTATPIPRTLAVTIYGDLDVSILDELPRGRQPIATHVGVGDDDRERAYALIRSAVAQGRQAFIVYALRDESDKTELRSAKAEAKRLAQEVFPDLGVGLVHGDMKSADKEQVMGAFRDGEIDVLVATTVIEVGVDVPNATVMVIEDAERFGIAQLHQLRGRIGRGEHASTCILMTDLDLTRAEQDPAIALARERLTEVASTQDGFRLAEVDLRQRREGTITNARQSGASNLRLVRVLEQREMIEAARRVAIEILDQDPELRAWEHQELKREMEARFPEQELDVVQSG